VRTALILLTVLVSVVIAFALGVHVGARIAGTNGADNAQGTAAQGTAAQGTAAQGTAAQGTAAQGAQVSSGQLPTSGEATAPTDKPRSAEAAAPDTTAAPRAGAENATAPHAVSETAPRSSAGAERDVAAASSDGSANGDEPAPAPATFDAPAETGTGDDKAKPPAWVAAIMADYRGGADAVAGGETQAQPDAAAAARGQNGGETAPTLLAVAPPTYAIQTRRALSAPRARKLRQRFDRPPLTPVLVRVPGSGSVEGTPGYYVRFTGFETRKAAARIARRLEPAMRKRLTVVRVASKPAP